MKHCLLIHSKYARNRACICDVMVSTQYPTVMVKKSIRSILEVDLVIHVVPCIGLLSLAWVQWSTKLLLFGVEVLRDRVLVTAEDGVSESLVEHADRPGELSLGRGRVAGECEGCDGVLPYVSMRLLLEDMMLTKPWYILHRKLV